MPQLSLAKFLASFVSLAILAAAAYLLATWAAGEQVTTARHHLVLLRESWRLWVGLALLAWSFLGRSAILTVAAGWDTRPTEPLHTAGRMLQSDTGAELFVETHGPAGAPQVIFTHGWGMDASFWNYARQDLGDRFEVVFWDLPGLGRSRLPPDGRVELGRFAADLETLIAASGDRRPVLVGHSIGGVIIQTLARDRPEVMSRLAGVVLLHTTYANPLKTMALSDLVAPLQPVIELLARLTIRLAPVVRLINWQSYFSGSAHLVQRLGFGRHVTRSQLDQVTLLATRNPVSVLAKGDLAMFGWDATGALRRLAAPVLVVGGDRDVITSPEASRTIAEQSPRASLEVIHGANHMAPLERAHTYDRLIGDFVLAVQPSATRDVRPDVAPAGEAAVVERETPSRPPPRGPRQTPPR
jgi:pimeloyl-ACP methyl ester carboxylesterase